MPHMIPLQIHYKAAPLQVQVYRTMASAQPQQPHQVNEEIWTTADELSYVRGLHRHGKIQALRVYCRWAHERRWYGPGMRVNAGIVILEARDLLADLVKKVQA